MALIYLLGVDGDGESAIIAARQLRRSYAVSALVSHSLVVAVVALSLAVVVVVFQFVLLTRRRLYYYEMASTVADYHETTPTLLWQVFSGSCQNITRSRRDCDGFNALCTRSPLPPSLSHTFTS